MLSQERVQGTENTRKLHPGRPQPRGLEHQSGLTQATALALHSGRGLGQKNVSQDKTKVSGKLTASALKTFHPVLLRSVQFYPVCSALPSSVYCPGKDPVQAELGVGPDED